MNGERSNLGQGQTIFRVKLHNFSVLLKKLARILLSIESEASTSLMEPQVPNRLLGLANGIESLESLEKDEGELFASFITSFIGIIQNLGVLRKHEERYREESIANLSKVLRVLRALEEAGKEFLPSVISVDEERKIAHHETFGGLLQRLIDAIQEKRHLISRQQIEEKIQQ